MEEHWVEVCIDRHEDCEQCRSLFGQLEFEMGRGEWKEAGTTCLDLESHLQPDTDDEEEE